MRGKMEKLVFQEMTPATLPASLAVNKRYEAVLSPLDLCSLEQLVTHSCYARQTRNGDAFLIAFNNRTFDESENYSWFQSRYDNFVYVDRIAIAQTLQRGGLARAFYNDLFDFAANNGADKIAAEVNTAPANPASHAFHQSMGFHPVGDATFSPEKSVRYYLKNL